jgi:hypothetical protein
MEPLLEENEIGEVDEIIYPETSYCDKCKLLITWVAVWTFGFGFGFLTKTYTFNDESCNGSM